MGINRFAYVDTMYTSIQTDWLFNLCLGIPWSSQHLLNSNDGSNDSWTTSPAKAWVCKTAQNVRERHGGDMSTAAGCPWDMISKELHKKWLVSVVATCSTWGYMSTLTKTYRSYMQGTFISKWCGVTTIFSNHNYFSTKSAVVATAMQSFSTDLCTSQVSGPVAKLHPTRRGGGHSPGKLRRWLAEGQPLFITGSPTDQRSWILIDNIPANVLVWI